MEAIKDQLYRSFRLYVEYATPYLQEGLPWLPKEAADKKIVPLLSPSLSWFRTTIEKIEESREFDALVLYFSFAL